MICIFKSVPLHIHCHFNQPCLHHIMHKCVCRQLFREISSTWIMLLLSVNLQQFPLVIKKTIKLELHVKAKLETSQIYIPLVTRCNKGQFMRVVMGYSRRFDPSSSLKSIRSPTKILEGYDLAPDQNF